MIEGALLPAPRGPAAGRSIARCPFHHSCRCSQFPQAGLREITSLRSLRHPNIIELRDIALSSKSDVFLVFEFCDNDLMVMMDHRSEAFTEAQAKCVLVQLLSAVQHVHALGYVHRDIKMSNLLYRNGVVKLGDFGLARPCSPDSA